MNDELELKCISSFTSRLPHIRGLGRLANLLIKLYKRKKREIAISQIDGMRFELDPNDILGSMLLFTPQYYEHKEIQFIKDVLKKGDTFIDIGAHIGLFSLIASQILGNDGKVISIEANPNTFQALKKNIELNGITNIIPMNVGASDRVETKLLCREQKDNSGGFSFLNNQRDYLESVDVQCVPISQIIETNNIQTIDFLKIDVEGYEYVILKHLFENVNNKLYPKFILLEINDFYINLSGSNPKLLLEQYNYKVIKNFKDNIVMGLN